MLAPAWYRSRIANASDVGVAVVTKAGSIALATGIIGWALAQEPWQLFAATLLSGGGWVTMGAAAVNAIIAPWFVRTRPAVQASAYNGSSIGGGVFSPLWVAAIGLVMVVTICVLTSIMPRRPSKWDWHPTATRPV